MAQTDGDDLVWRWIEDTNLCMHLRQRDDPVDYRHRYSRFGTQHPLLNWNVGIRLPLF